MAEFGGKNQKKSEQAEQKRAVTHKESQAPAEQLHAWEQNSIPLGETPFQPSLNQHAELLSRARSDSERANLTLQLQQNYGNRYVQRLMRSIQVQAKLTVSQPGDPYEMEADRVSEQAVRMVNSQVSRQAEEEEELQTKPAADIHRQPEEEEEPLQAKLMNQVQRQEDEEEVQTKLQRQAEEEEEIQAQSDGSQPMDVSANLESRINAASGSGQALPDQTRGSMEKVFGADFSSVHTHTDSEADSLNQQLSARAFTRGQDIFFRQGEYNPGSQSGQKLIAHELTHVVQQTGGSKTHRSVDNTRNQTPQKEEVMRAVDSSVIQRDGEEEQGFGQLLKFWKGQESKGKAKYGNLKSVAGQYKGENVRSPIANQIIAAVVKKAQETGIDLVTLMSKQFNWSKEDVERYIMAHEQPFVKYLTSESAREEYEIVGGASLKQGKPPKPFDTANMFSKHSGQGFGIYVMSPDGRLYAGVHKVGLFHHSSFLAGLPTAGAGELKVNQGTLNCITNKSGHYQPGRAQMVNVLQQLKERGVNLNGVRLDLVNEMDNYPGGAGTFLKSEEEKAEQARKPKASSDDDDYEDKFTEDEDSDEDDDDEEEEEAPKQSQPAPSSGSSHYAELKFGQKN